MSVPFRAGAGSILLLALVFGCGKVTRNPTTDAEGEANGDAGAPIATGGDTSAGGSAGGPALGGATTAGTGQAGNDGRCGDGKKDPGEACDLGLENGAPTSCCNLFCHLSPQGKICRPAAPDECDPLEICDGAQPICPPDKREPDGAPCAGNGISDCSGADQCVAGVCANNDFGAGTPCGPGKAEPVCNPDKCDGSGSCVDAPLAATGTACEGGSCCGASCVKGGAAAADCCALPDPPKLVVDIIESESLNAAHTMDIHWLELAEQLDFVAAIRPQTYLDDVASLLSTNVLVVASGLIDLPANRVATIQAFVKAGGGVYLQGEYQPSFGPNQAFSQIVNATGGELSWIGEVDGDLQPVQILGCWASTAQQVTPLDYFWYGATAVTTAEVIARSSTGTSIGWSWCVPGLGNGQIVQLTDQDAFKDPTVEDKALMHNILTRLAYAKSCD